MGCSEPVHVMGTRSTADSISEGRMRPNIGKVKKTKKRKILEKTLNIKKYGKK